MGNSTFSGPLRTGTIREGVGLNLGHSLMTQTATFAFGDTGSFSTTIILPSGSQIVDMHVDVFTAWDSATSDALEIGDGSDVDIYGDVTDLQQTGRLITVLDGTQIAAIDAIGTSDVTVTLTISSSGGSLTAGSGRITMIYRQN